MELGSFPTDSVLMEKYFRLFEAGKAVAIVAFPTLITARAIYNLISQKGANDYGILIRDAIMGIVLLTCFTTIFSTILKLPDFYGSLFPDLAADDTFFNKMLSPLEKSFSSYADWASIAVFYVTGILYLFAFTISAALAAYIIVVGMMIQQYWLVKTLFSFLVFASLWPLMWYAINAVISSFHPSDGLSAILAVMLANLCKAMIPILPFLSGMLGKGAQTVKMGASAAKLVGGKTISAAAGTTKFLGGERYLNAAASKYQTTIRATKAPFSRVIPGAVNAAKSGIKGINNFKEASRLKSVSKNVVSQNQSVLQSRAVPQNPGDSPRQPNKAFMAAAKTSLSGVNDSRRIGRALSSNKQYRNRIPVKIAQPTAAHRSGENVAPETFSRRRVIGSKPIRKVLVQNTKIKNLGKYDLSKSRGKT